MGEFGHQPIAVRTAAGHPDSLVEAGPGEGGVDSIGDEVWWTGNRDVAIHGDEDEKAAILGEDRRIQTGCRVQGLVQGNGLWWEAEHGGGLRHAGGYDSQHKVFDAAAANCLNHTIFPGVIDIR